jgi:hypothetical protein
MFTLETGSGFWNPLLWLIIFGVAFLVIYIYRGRGRADYKKDTEQTKAFLSGNEEYDAEHMHVKASNLYWGFTTSMQGFYKVLKRMHSGNISDYILWFVIILAVLFIIEVI